MDQEFPIAHKPFEIPAVAFPGEKPGTSEINHSLCLALRYLSFNDGKSDCLPAPASAHRAIEGVLRHGNADQQNNISSLLLWADSIFPDSWQVRSLRLSYPDINAHNRGWSLERMYLSGRK